MKSFTIRKMRLFPFICMLLTAAWATGQPVTTTFSTGGGQVWTCPCGVTSATVECWGSGGGGGGAATGATVAGGGGSGGASSTKTFTVVPGTTYNINVGLGGTANAGTAAQAGSGNSSWFNSTGGNTAPTTILGNGILAVGGAGGTGSVTNGAGGAGGAAVVTGNVTGAGITNFYGGSGAAGVAATAGGGGGGAGGTATGGNASGGTGGTSTGGGNGAAGQAGNGNGTAGTAPGGGGSGARRTSGTRSGGAGGLGRVTITYTPVGPGTPTALTATSVTSTSALLGWTNPTGTVTADTIQYRVGASGPFTGRAVVTGSGNSYSLTGLTPNTLYNFEVQSSNGSVCPGTFSAVKAFTTLCTNSTLPVVQGFNATTIPSCWTQTTVSNGDAAAVLSFVATDADDIGTVGPEEGSDFASFNSFTCEVGDEIRLVSAPITTTGTASVDVVLYWYYDNSFLNTYYDTMFVQYSLNGTTWVTVKPIMEEVSGQPNGWTAITVTLPSGAGNVANMYVGFLFKSGFGDDMLLDNVSIHATPNCIQPINLALTTLTPTTAGLSWAAPTHGDPPANYKWEVRTSGIGGSGPTGLAASGSTVAPAVTATASGLTASTSYSLYVQNVCGSNDSSFWSGPVAFTTPCNPTTVPDTFNFDGVSPLTCWAIIDANADGFTWGLGASTLTGGSGTHSLEYIYGCNGPADDWAITQGLTLTGGTSYRVTYLYGTDFGEANSLAVYYGTAPTVGAMTNTLIPTYSFTNTTYAVRYADFTPSTTGTYYIGFLANTTGTCNGDIFIDNVDIGLSPACLPPLVSSVTYNSSTSVTVNFTCMGCSPGDSFVLEYGTPGFTPGIGITAGGGTVIVNTGSPVTISGLSSNTSYDVYVRQSCVSAGHGYSANSFDFNFTTPCAASSIPYTEGFETTGAGSLPTCAAYGGVDAFYAEVESGPGFDVGAIAHTGTNYLDFESCAGAPNYFYTPPFSLTGGVTYQFSFWYVTDGEPGWNYLTAYYGPNQSQVGAIAITGDSVANPTNTTYRQLNGTFTPATSGYYFIGIGESDICGLNEDLSVDDLSLTIPVCPTPVPSAIIASAVTTTTATVSWACASCTGTYYIEYGPTGFTPGTGAAAGSGASLVVTSGTTSVSLTSLLAGTTYDVYVRDNCSGTNYSSNGYGQFTTVCPASTPMPYTQNFDASISVPNCWTIIDANGDGTTWAVASEGPYDFVMPTGGSLPNAIIYTNSFGDNGNDWAVTPAFLLDSGVSYRLSYLYSGDGGVEKLGVFYGTLPVATSLTNTLVATANVAATVTTFTNRTVDFVPTATATYYIGFKCTSTEANGQDLFVDNVTVKLTPPCPTTPTALSLSALNPTSATVTATCASCTGIYYAEYGAFGFSPSDTATPGIGGTIDTSHILPITLTGLTPSTTYTLYLRDNCTGGGIGFSDNSTPLTFTTPCLPVSVPYSQNFDASTAIPSCWTILDANNDGTTWAVAAEGPYDFVMPTGGSLPNAIIYTNSFSANGNDWAVTPGFTLDSGISYRLKYQYSGDGGTEKLGVFYGAVPQAASLTTTLAATANVTATTFQQATIDFIPAATKTYYIGFHATSTEAAGEDLFIDNVVIERTPACPTAPSAVAVGSITFSGASVAFTCASCTGTYYLEYGPTGFSPGDSAVAGPGGTIVTGTSSPIALTGLSPGITYDVYVRDNCSGTGYSENSSVVTFTTPCMNTTLPVYSGFNSTSIPMCWTQQVVSGTDGNVMQFVPNASIMPDPATSPEEGSDFVWFQSWTYAAGDQNRLISPPITTTGVPSVATQFYWYFDNGEAGVNDSMYVQYSINGGTTWINALGVPRQPPVGGSLGWQKVSVTLPSAAGNVSNLLVGFLFVSYFGDNMSMDSVLIEAAPPSAVLSGTGGAVCSGATVPLTVTITGTGPYTGTLSDGTPFSGASSPITVNVNPTSLITYTIATLTDLYYTSTPLADLTGSVAITTVHPRPGASISGSPAVCQHATESYTATFAGTAPWAFTIDTGGGTITSTSSSGFFTFSISPVASKTLRVTALSDAYCATPSLAADTLRVTVTTNCIITWTGITGTDWGTSTNWNPNLIPNSCSVDVTIPTGTTNKPVISSASYQIGNLTMGNSQIITLTGFNLSVCKNFTGPTSSGAAFKVPGSGSLIMDGTVAQTISGYGTIDAMTINNTAGVSLPNNATNHLSIYRGLTLQTGTLTVANSAAIILLSTNIDTVAWLNDFGGNTGHYTGNLTVQRQIPVTGTAWQHVVSAPVNGTGVTFYALGQSTYGWNTATYLTPSINCSEDSISWTSRYSTGLTWHESHVGPYDTVHECVTLGWETVGGGDTWIAGQGYSVYLTSGSRISLAGAPNTGAVNVAGLTNSNWLLTTPEGNTYNSGWSFVGNPYPSSLELGTSRLPNGFDAQVQVYQPSGAYHGSYSPYLIGTVTLHLPAYQGFSVHKTAVGGTATWPFFQSERSTNEGSSYQFYKAPQTNHLSIDVAGNGFADVTRIEFNPQATDGFDAEYDANKLPSNEGQPTLYTNIPGSQMWMGINSMGALTTSTTVPVGFKPGADGTFTFTVSPDDIASFDPTTYIYLEDKQNPGNWVNLRTNSSYTFASKASDAQGRFLLHFALPAATSGITDVSADANVNIFAVHDNVMVDFSKLTSVDATIQIYNILGQELSSETHHTTDTYVKAINLDAAYIVVKVRMADGQIIGKKLFIAK